MKGKAISFRPKAQFRERLESLAESTERPVTFFVEKSIEAHLPELEQKYKTELEALRKKKELRPPLEKPRRAAA